MCTASCFSAWNYGAINQSDLRFWFYCLAMTYLRHTGTHLYLAMQFYGYQWCYTYVCFLWWLTRSTHGQQIPLSFPTEGCGVGVEGLHAPPSPPSLCCRVNSGQIIQGAINADYGKLTFSALIALAGLFGECHTAQYCMHIMYAMQLACMCAQYLICMYLIMSTGITCGY